MVTQLKIPKADFFGFSNGGTTCLLIAIRHPQLVVKLVLASTIFTRDGMKPGFFEGMKKASLENMPKALQDAYLKANPDPKGLHAMFDRDEEVLYHREIAKVYKEDGTLTDAWIYWYNGDVNGRSRIVSGDALEFVSSKKKLIQ